MNNIYAILLAFSGTLFSLLAFYTVYLHWRLEEANDLLASLKNENKYLSGWSGTGKDPKASYSELV